jgi:glycosyltransferase involved in cell wall biosynthesis
VTHEPNREAMDSATVSVIITCYNLGQYLEEAVASVLAQSYQNYEILIVDDGSTDAYTRRLLSDYRRPLTRVLRSEHRGLPAAKNLGIAHTTGQYVCALDADDRLDVTLLEKSVAALDADSSLAFVSHWFRTFGEETWDWTPTRCDFPALLEMNTVNGAALVRRSALEAVGGFDETMRKGCEDWDLWITLVERGLKGQILPEVLFYYRRREGSMSRVMMEGNTHPRIYRYLAEKHQDSFRQHLASLLLRRERDISAVQHHIQDLELQRYRWLEPEIGKYGDDVAQLERKRLTHHQSVKAEIQSQLEAELEVERSRVNRALAEVLELRHSASWRITAPLRMVYEQLLRVKRQRGSE